MRAFFKFFAERHLFSSLITVMIVLMGGITLLRINRSVFPKIDFGMMRITTYYPGASPEDVELNVTNKIEDELKSVTGIKQIGSTSMENISIVVVVIDPDVSDHPDFINHRCRAAAPGVRFRRAGYSHVAMALALGYGLLFATPITLILVPSLYMIGHDIRKLFQ